MKYLKLGSSKPKSELVVIRWAGISVWVTRKAALLLIAECRTRKHRAPLVTNGSGMLIDL